MGEATGSESVYAVIASWMTHSCLFIFINLVIGTIVITSRFATPRRQQGQRDSPHQLAPSPSFLHRVRSFNLGYNKYDSESEPEPPTEFSPDPVQTHRDSPRLARDPSKQERVKSISFVKQETPCSNPVNPTRPELNHAPSLLERIMSLKLYRSESIKSVKNELGSEIPEQDDPTGTEPVHAPSLLERIKSMKLYRLESTKPGKNEPGSGSESGPDMDCNKSSHGEDEGVDKKADDFINKFKQQLRMQRLESILRYRDLFKGN